jgi:hypothetical protein
LRDEISDGEDQLVGTQAAQKDHALQVP